ncbi:thiol oxidoreductase [Parabacteroides sp. GYB001]|uniref:di-heme oxidoredictase family protein n=1 Tax=Parabacteroides leei TaxID=2939491 RepID=UPI0020170F24|nr:di-heme oxidoredictase family protein [Parabacteroides leei]MCL3852521.1 thiol oxidoreductase [Parabacteroides leei]
MKQVILPIVLLAGILCTACEDGLDDTLIKKPNGTVAKPEELSAGYSTIFSTGPDAYDMSAEWVTGELNSRFNRGNSLYDTSRGVDENGGLGGLGPVYAGYSCASCHKGAGRTKPTLFTDGGSGNYGFSSVLIYITRKGGGFFPEYGRVLHDQAIYGSKPEGKLKATYTEKEYKFPDGEKYSLITPHYEITNWYADSIAPNDLRITVRIPLRHVGMGQMMALDLDELQKLAAQSNYPEYGISGRLNWITERGKKQIGVSGNKAQHADLTVELGFSSDMGVTNDRYPEEVCEGQTQMMGFANYGIQISTLDMENVDLYMQCLGVPARRNVANETIKRGEEMFYEAKCHLCHTVTLHTRPRGTVLLNNTQLPWLGSQVIHPYSDFLLHDMGPGLDDDYQSGLAMGCEWRTTPLWGIGLQELVNGHTYFLHDGRARNLTEAIMWHDGEGAASRILFSRMTKDDREALLTFLKSL